MVLVGGRTQRKITLRLLPFVLLLYITAYIDRVNVGFAGLSMTKDLGFSNEVFGFGAGIFFFGYCLLEIPGAMLAEVWSARKWIVCIMLLWGAVAGCTGLIHNAVQFSVMRFLLGLAEGGFFPAVIVYLTHWFTYEQRGKAIAILMAGIPLSSAIGAPLAGLLLQVRWLGLPSWRWLLILEGIPAVLAAIVTFFYLPDRPADAGWLMPEERDWIINELRSEQQRKQSFAPARKMAVWRHPVVIAVTLSYFMLNISGYGLTFWLPKIVQKLSGFGTMQLSLLVAVPYLVSVPAMFLCGWHSDKRDERRWHATLAALLGGAGLAFSQVFDGSPALAFTAITLAAIGMLAYYPPMWAIPTQFLSERTAAASFGFINLLANLGGFVGPYAVGFFTDRTGNYTAGIYVLVGTAVAGALIISLVRTHDKQEMLPVLAAEA